MQSNTSLVDIRTFVTIAEQGSFTKAAAILQSSRAHVSRQLTQLEKQLGVQLIIRTTRAQRLTPTGELFFQQCLASLQAIEQAVITAKDDTESLHGNININCVGGIIGEDIVADLLAEFNLLHPDITLELDLSSQRVDLIAESFDLVVRMGELQDSGLVARKLTDIKVQVLASPDYLARHPTIHHPKQLVSHNCLTGSIKRWRFQQNIKLKTDMQQEDLEVNVQGNFSCKSGRALINAAKNSNGIVRLPVLYCEDEINNRTLVPAIITNEIEEQWHSPDVPLYLLYHRNRYQPIRLKLLIEFICNKFNNVKTNK
ncbi:LysR family transcriptional regulator [Psychromonas marina]|uniref:LysR family transcriptional regulator n=1 Tax=Psychromonas marina TaxID=88364 RepID=A0ABQ6E4Q5_9GAMM|nr:LysR family transcriptional regulator [Psychromonas marina]GLS92387.1 LysR family transcriptional regulator [Psychromonas marina]